MGGTIYIKAEGFFILPSMLFYVNPLLSITYDAGLIVGIGISAIIDTDSVYIIIAK